MTFFATEPKNLIFLNVYDQERAYKGRHIITKEQATCLAPYRKDNINLFGVYFLDELREKMIIDFGLPAVSLSN